MKKNNNLFTSNVQFNEVIFYNLITLRQREETFINELQRIYIFWEVSLFVSHIYEKRKRTYCHERRRRSTM